MLFSQTHVKERKKIGTVAILSCVGLFDVSCHSTENLCQMPFSELHYLVCSSFTMLLGIYIPFLFFLRPYLVFPAARHSESCSVVFESHDGKLGCDENFNKVNLS